MSADRRRRPGFLVVLSMQAKMERSIAGQPVFLDAHLAGVRSRLSQLSLQANRGISSGGNRSEFLLFVLSVDAQLDEQILDFLITEVCHRRLRGAAANRRRCPVLRARTSFTATFSGFCFLPTRIAFNGIAGSNCLREDIEN